MSVVRLYVPRDDGGGIDAFVQCYVINGPFWMLAGAVLVLFFPFWSGPFWFAWAVFDLHWGRFGDGPFWSVPHFMVYFEPKILLIMAVFLSFCNYVI